MASTTVDPNTTLFTLLRRPENRDTVRKLIGTSVMMVLLPVCTYFACHEFLLPSAGVTQRREVWSAVASLFATNVVMAIYAISAFQEDCSDDGDTAAQDTVSNKKKQ